MPNLKKRGDIWHYAFTVDGKRFRQSAGTSDKRLAEDIAIKHESAVRRAAVHGPQAVLTFEEAVSLYINAGKDSRFILPLLDHFGRMLVADITGPLIRQAAKEIYPGRAEATLNRQVIVPVRAVINHAADAGMANKMTVKRFREARDRRPAGTKQWLETFRATALALDMPETAALARFLFETATRISEACRLCWDDVDLARGEAWLERTKTVPRRVFLTPGMVADLANLKDRHPRLVFKAANRSTARKRFDKVITQAGLTRLTSHEFGRHGFATEMIVRNGIDVATTGDLGGWKSRRLLMETYVEGDNNRAVIDRVFQKTNDRNKR